MTASQLLSKVRGLGPARIVFRFPYIHLIYESEEFDALEENQRESIFSKKLGLSISEIRRTSRNALFSLHLLTPAEAEQQFPKASYEGRGYHWLTAYAEEQLGQEARFIPSQLPVKIVHFYGYKGGQARSTLLALIARDLAEAGWRVLTVDADLEAPSLDVIFSRTARSLSSTLLGLFQSSGEVSPERILASQGSGYIDLISCRPQSQEYDIDAAALSLRAILDPADIDKAAFSIGKLAVEKSYDIVIIDHRSGLSHTTLPWMFALPGPSVICLALMISGDRPCIQ